VLGTLIMSGRKQVVINLPTEVASALDLVCEQLGLSRTKLVSKIIMDWYNEFSKSAVLSQITVGYRDNGGRQRDQGQQQ